MNSWEIGSEFNIVKLNKKNNSFPFNYTNVNYLGSGRDAIRSLLLFGKQKLNWKRIFVPSYLCQEVVRSIMSTQIKIIIYQDNPLSNCNYNLFEFEKGDVLFIVNYFGLKLPKNYDSIDRTKVTVIEDHTHNPFSSWALSSKADYCIASLRKVLPIPDGGIVWTNTKNNLELKYNLTSSHRIASLQKFTAMALKSLYLDQYPIEKSIYRELFILGEGSIVDNEISAISEWSLELIKNFDLKHWLVKKQQNYLFLNKLFENIPWITVLKPENDTISPFSFVLLFNSNEKRTLVYKKLIENSIYPSILWPLDDAVFKLNDEDISISKRILSIHCDARYSKSDFNLFFKIFSQI